MRGCSGKAMIEARTDEAKEIEGGFWDRTKEPVLSCGMG